MRRRIFAYGGTVLVAAILAVGCGSSGSKSADSSPAGGKATTGASNASPGALSSEANSAATGDIPDNQVFVTLRNAAGGYSMQYPEGWLRRGGAGDVTLQDKNNLVHIVVRPGAPPAAQAVAADLARERSATPSLQAGSASNVTVAGRRAVKVSYSIPSAANPVTGKRVVLLVDRYVLSGPGRYAIVDLATPRGVDNVDAYRMIIASFRWR